MTVLLDSPITVWKNRTTVQSVVLFLKKGAVSLKMGQPQKNTSTGIVQKAVQMPVDGV